MKTLVIDPLSPSTVEELSKNVDLYYMPNSTIEEIEKEIQMFPDDWSYYYVEIVNKGNPNLQGKIVDFPNIIIGGYGLYS